MIAPCNRRSGAVGQFQVQPEWTRRYVARGELLPAGMRILIHTVRPVAAGADFRTLEALPRLVPTLRAHPQLRGALPVQRGDRLRSMWMVYDVRAPTNADAIVAAMARVSPRDLSYSIITAAHLATIEEMTRDAQRWLQQTIEALPFVGPPARALRRASEAEGWTAILWAGIALAAGALVAYTFGPLRRSRKEG